MPNVTITGGSVCAGGDHRVIETDQGIFNILNSELGTRAESFSQLKDRALAIINHQYLARRDAGRTHNQALQDLIGFVIRL